MTTQPARRLWEVVEPIHAVVYFSAAASTTYKAIGLKGWWMGYFASRAAALGPVGPQVVTAAFHGFAPAVVAQAVPDCWARASPADVLAARSRLAADALADPVARCGLDVGSLAADLVTAVGRLSFEGRVLAAAHASLPVPDDPLLALWWACTVLREHRGDGHVAALVAHGISPVEAHVLKVAVSEASQDALRPYRGWTEEEWSSARLGLLARSLLTEDGRLSEEGAILCSVLEHVTDTAAEPGWWALGGGDASAAAIDQLAALAAAAQEAGALPLRDALGLPGPRPA